MFSMDWLAENNLFVDFFSIKMIFKILVLITVVFYIEKRNPY